MKTYELTLTDVKNNKLSVSIKTDETDLSVIAGSLAGKLVKFYRMTKKYKASTGFLFHRKFTISFKYEGKLINSMLSQDTFKLTMHNLEKVVYFINDLTYDVLSLGGYDEALTIEDVLEQINN